VKFMTEIELDQVQLGIFDREHAQATNTVDVKANVRHGTVLEADVHQKMTIRFSVRDRQAKKPISVHQAFVVFVHEKTNQEIIFVAETDTTNVYKFDVDFQKSAHEFEGVSGKYHIRLVVGDSAVSNAIDWNLVDVSLKLPEFVKPPVKKSEEIIYDKLPEIQHLFREAEKRPPQVVSDVFSLLALAPFVVLLLLWLRIGINFGNMPMSIWVIVFHAGLAGIFFLYFTFWLRLDMFVTLKYLTIIGALTFLAGNRLLRSLAEARKQKVE